MKFNVSQHKTHELFEDRMGEEIWERDYKGTQGHKWD
jgi:hypothetical protein